MPLLPTLDYEYTDREVTDTFAGYNHKLKIGAGEFYDTENLTSAYYPLLAERKKRGLVKQLTAPGGLLGKEELAYVDNGTLWYNGEPTALTGLTAGEKQLVSMGAYICVFPDKKYYNTADAGDHGSMEAYYTSTGTVKYTMCRADGTEYAKPTVSAAAPEEPENAALWIDTSQEKHVLKQWSSATQEWVSVPTVYTRVQFISEGELPGLFDVYDGVEISGAGVEDVNETACRGVQKGSGKSLVVVNETLLYKSRSDICAYQGGFPSGISDALGEELYSDAAAGAIRDRYYISMKDSKGEPQLFVYDMGKRLWMREDSLGVDSFARVGDELYAISGKLLYAMQGTVGEPEPFVSWKAETGILYYQYPDKKYISRFNIRAQMEEGAEMDVYIQYDSSGVWERKGRIKLKGTNTVTVPIRPRRCDHMRIRLEGKGMFRLFSAAKIISFGSDM